MATSSETPGTTAFQAKLLSLVADRPGLTDRELTDLLFGKVTPPSRVNGEAHHLGNLGRLFRRLREDGRFGNYPVSALARKQLSKIIDGVPLQESLGSNQAAEKRQARAERSPPAAYTVTPAAGVCPVDLDELKRGILSVMKLARFEINAEDVQLQWTPAPHRRPSSLPANMQAVYCFFLDRHCLKVGKAGPNSQPRFTSHHYYCKAPSTLAKSILAGKDRVLTLLKEELQRELHTTNEEIIGKWMETHTARLNVLIPAKSGPHVLSFVEAFLHCRLQPLFEGHG